MGIAKHGVRALAACTAATCLAVSSPATAHPHVWVTYEMTVSYENGAATGVDHVWTFDDAYSAMAIEGLDKNNDGKYDRGELAELAQINMDGLKDFNYFTFAKLGDKDLSFKPPVDPWLEYNNGILRLHYRLPLSEPVRAEAGELNISVYDPSFFIAFEPEAKDPVRLASAPNSCTAKVTDPASDAAAADAARLGDAFAQKLGGNAVNVMASFKTISVHCGKL